MARCKRRVLEGERKFHDRIWMENLVALAAVVKVIPAEVRVCESW